jgi:hypothetical protein
MVQDVKDDLRIIHRSAILKSIRFQEKPEFNTKTDYCHLPAIINVLFTATQDFKQHFCNIQWSVMLKLIHFQIKPEFKTAFAVYCFINAS